MACFELTAISIKCQFVQLVVCFDGYSYEHSDFWPLIGEFYPHISAQVRARCTARTVMVGSPYQHLHRPS